MRGRESEMSTIDQTYPPILTSSEAARLFQCSVHHIQELARDGMIPAWRTPNGQWRFSRDRLISVVADGTESSDSGRHSYTD